MENTTPILHQNLKPSNILRDVRGKWLLADFGISHVLTGAQTHKTKLDWKAAELHLQDDQSRYQRESDIQVKLVGDYCACIRGRFTYYTRIFKARFIGADHKLNFFSS